MDRLQFSHGMLSCCEWTGVLLSTLLQECGVQKGAKWILAEGSDGSHMSRSIPMEKAMDDALIVYAQNGEALRPEQGYPVRLINPGWEGNTCVKWLRRLEIGDKPWYHREETSKYTDLLPNGKAREFTFVQEANSVLTNPCPEKPLTKPGKLWVEGLAWSGRGRIKHVDVSFDGGVNVLTLYRGAKVIPNPKESRELEAGDKLLCFGRMDVMRDMIPARTRRKQAPKVLNLDSEVEGRHAGTPATTK